MITVEPADISELFFNQFKALTLGHKILTPQMPVPEPAMSPLRLRKRR